jgi:hypothetical protein
MIDLTDFIKKNFNDMLLFLVGIAKKELQEQGHTLTGKLEKSLRVEISISLNSFVGKVYVSDYGIILDKGVKANKIPYRKGSGAKTSKYIEALTKYFQLRGLDFKKAKGAAFATAHKQKIEREGMPTRNSYRFASNGRRTGWIKRVTMKSNINQSLKILKLALFAKNAIETAVTRGLQSAR